MRTTNLAVTALLLSIVGKITAQTDTAEMAEARVMGVTVVQLMQENLKDRDAESFPGIHSWMMANGNMFGALNKDRPEASWRDFDSRKLVIRDTNFWQLFYEVVPADPGLAMLHAGALMVAGDADRAQTILRLTLHRGDLDENIQKIIISIMRHCGRFMSSSHMLVKEGVVLHDSGDFEGALNKYDAAMQLWPLNGWAAYERGTTFRIRDKDDSPAVIQAFAQSREKQPFQFHAWQGTVKDIPGMTEMLTEMPGLWETSLKDIRYVMKPEELLKMSEILQLAEVDDLALTVRQIYIVRRGRYMPEDHPFISKSLRRLVPGPQAETTIAKLGGSGLTLTQIYQAPVPGQTR